MQFTKNDLFHTFLGIVLLTVLVKADNPIVNYHYLADPTTFVIDDTFWIIADLDDENVSGYNIKAYYALSSKDMVNWTDHGEVFRVPRDVSWAGAAWAPAAAWRNDKTYIYYPNGTSGIGVAVASTPAGPYTDPVGKAIVDTKAVNGNYCDNVVWCFDPGVFIDTDGQAYLIWGGGGAQSGKPTYDENFRMMKLNSDMTTLSGSLITVNITNNSGNEWSKSFEAAYITKRNGIYYLSYSTRGLAIGYATSTSLTGPWTYKGNALANPNVNGTNINSSGNNHHGWAEFKGKWYSAYHDRRLAIANNDSRPDLHRSVSIDELKFNTDGTIQSMIFTNSGPAQIVNFNPYDSMPATTMSLAKNIKSLTVLNKPNPPWSLLIPKPSNAAWQRLSNVDFDSGASKFVFSAASLNANNKVEIRTGSATGTLISTCNVPNTGSWGTFSTVECDVNGLTGVVSQLYIKYTGTDSTMAVRWMKFIPSFVSSSSSSVPASSSSAIPQGPYNSASIPGIIQAENYDLGGEGVAYHDEDTDNRGRTYRNDGVDITGDSANGYQVGYTVTGEWLEYTVNITQAGIYTWEASVSSELDNAGFRLLLDNQDITGSIVVPNTSNWDTYKVISGTTSSLPEGEHVLRLEVEGSYFNIDWLEFSLKSTKLLHGKASISLFYTGTYRIYNLLGILLGTLNLTTYSDISSQLHHMGMQPGIYVLRSEKTGNTYPFKLFQ